MKTVVKKTTLFLAAILVLFSLTGALSGCSNDTLNSQDVENSKIETANHDIQVSDSTKQDIEDSEIAEKDLYIESDTNSQQQPITQSDTQELTGRLDAHFLDVGQADCAFIILPNKQSILIDAGNESNGFEIVSYIKARGYQKIDYVIATHPHADHIGGMSAVINSFAIDKFYMPKVSHTSATFENMLNALKQNNIGVNTAKSGVNILDIPDLKIDIIAPNSTGYDDLNNYSAVVKIKFKNNSFLFMGDAESVSENEINTDVSANVIKIGHHGSSSSSQPSFISNVSPEHAIISCGFGNSYGHPSDTTIQTLQNAVCKIYRTDEVGTVVASSDGTNITINKKAYEVKPNAPPENASTSNGSSSRSNSSVESTNNSSSVSNNTETTETTVYITKTGKKYHRAGCSYLKKSKIPISLSEARQSYGPCGRCNPPR